MLTDENEINKILQPFVIFTKFYAKLFNSSFDENTVVELPQ